MTAAGRPTSMSPLPPPPVTTIRVRTHVAVPAGPGDRRDQIDHSICGANKGESAW